MKISEVMNKNVISVSPDDSAAQAARLLSRHNIGSLPVLSADGRLRGIVTDRDIVLRCVAAESPPEQTPVRELMSRSPVTASPGDDLRQGAELMASHKIRRLPIADGGRLVGMLSLGDVAKAESCCMEASMALSEISENVRRR